MSFNKKDIYILGVETSCDETSASVVKNGRVVVSNIISSQIDIHKKYGGVVPEIASRKHVESISQIIDEAMEQAKMGFRDIDAIAVTNGPGLVGALLVGLSYSKALAFALKKPLVAVNHIEAHICANYINNDALKPPFICLVVSGGHTTLLCVRDYGKYEILGKTRDDAAGEAYDKVARAIGLGYPGGPKIDALALEGNCEAIQFPKAFLSEGNYDFSFSGLKSSVLNYINKCNMAGLGDTFDRGDLAASFQKAVVDVLVAKTMMACYNLNIKEVAMAGGVACNSALRQAMNEKCLQNGYNLTMPESIFCTDNGAMVASCGYFNFIRDESSALSLNAYPNLYIN